MGISGGELLVLGVAALLFVRPERLPAFAQQIGRVARELKRMANGASERAREEYGVELAELAALDPRQFDPRRIVREALSEKAPPEQPLPLRPYPPSRRTVEVPGREPTATEPGREPTATEPESAVATSADDA